MLTGLTFPLLELGGQKCRRGWTVDYIDHNLRRKCKKINASSQPLKAEQQHQSWSDRFQWKMTVPKTTGWIEKKCFITTIESRDVSHDWTDFSDKRLYWRRQARKIKIKMLRNLFLGEAVVLALIGPILVEDDMMMSKNSSQSFLNWLTSCIKENLIILDSMPRPYLLT